MSTCCSSKCLTLELAWTRARWLQSSRPSTRLTQIGQVVGTGLGLYGLKKHVEALSGECGVRKNLKHGSGTVFWFQVPYEKDETTNDEVEGELYSEETCIPFDTLHPSSADNHKTTSLLRCSTSSSTTIVPQTKATLSAQSDVDSFCSTIAPTFSMDLDQSSGELCHSPRTAVLLAKKQFQRVMPLVGTLPSDNMHSESDNSSISSKPTAAGPRAIIVDDSPTICKLLTRSLKKLGFGQVLTYENGAKGLLALKQEEVDFVFTDIQMPIMTGPEARSEHTLVVHVFPIAYLCFSFVISFAAFLFDIFFLLIFSCS
jgi:CheY-like chemotaxis protein